MIHTIRAAARRAQRGDRVTHYTGNGYAMHFFYDAQGRVSMVRFWDGAQTKYYTYVYNLQGDVIGLANSEGDLVVEYKYDAWGRVISRIGTLSATLGRENPFRYRGYVYDEETGYYYLRSRYYDPELRRFISIDSYNTLCGVWTYCSNSPIKYFDDTGYIGKPTYDDGFEAPKKSKQHESKYTGWEDKWGNIWKPAEGTIAHGGEHWDVQNMRKDKSVGHTNVYPGGAARKGTGTAPKLPLVKFDASTVIPSIPPIEPQPGPAHTIVAPTANPLGNGVESMPYVTSAPNYVPIPLMPPDNLPTTQHGLDPDIVIGAIIGVICVGIIAASGGSAAPLLVPALQYAF